MIIIWGTKPKKRDVGVIADRCDNCGDVQPFTLTDHFEAGHIYYISLTQGTYKASTAKCQTCGHEMICRKEDYAEVIPFEEADQLSLRDLLTDSNPRLLESMAVQANLQTMAQEEMASADAPGPDAARFQDAVAKLSEAGDSAENRQLMRRLESWPSLDPGQRQALLDEVDQFLDAGERVGRAVQFIQLIAPTYPESAGCLIGFLIFAAPMALFTLPFFKNLIWGTVLVAVSLAAGLFVFTRVAKVRSHGWVRRKLIPQADEQGVDLQVFIGVLAGIDTDDEMIDQQARNLAGGADAIAQVLLEDKLIQLDEETE